MKKTIKYMLIIIIFLIMVGTSKIYGATANISASKINAYVGDSVTINVNINAAAWNLSVSGNGINGGAITGFNIEGTNQSTSKSYSLNTSSVGTYVISLKGDISDGVTDVTTDISQSVTVTVTAKPVTPTQPTAPSTKPSSNTNASVNKPSINTNKPQATTPSLSSNAYLSEFRIDQPGITPEFNKQIYNYAVTVGEDVDNLNVTAVPENNKATISITGNTNLKEGNNTVTVRVTAQDKKTVNTYTINVTKANDEAKSNAFLQSIFVEDIKLIPDFSSEIFDYDLGKIENDIESLKISAFPVNENAKIDIIGNTNLVSGENIIKIIVTSENGKLQNTYNLKVIKENEERNEFKEVDNNKNSTWSDIFKTLKENSTVLLLYLFVWIEFLQVVYLYERLKKYENVDKE